MKLKLFTKITLSVFLSVALSWSIAHYYWNEIYKSKRDFAVGYINNEIFENANRIAFVDTTERVVVSFYDDSISGLYYLTICEKREGYYRWNSYRFTIPIIIDQSENSKYFNSFHLGFPKTDKLQQNYYTSLGHKFMKDVYTKFLEQNKINEKIIRDENFVSESCIYWLDGLNISEYVWIHPVRHDDSFYEEVPFYSYSKGSNVYKIFSNRMFKTWCRKSIWDYEVIFNKGTLNKKIRNYTILGSFLLSFLSIIFIVLRHRRK